jgi:hypothetical protein
VVVEVTMPLVDIGVLVVMVSPIGGSMCSGVDGIVDSMASQGSSG